MGLALVGSRIISQGDTADVPDNLSKARTRWTQSKLRVATSHRATATFIYLYL